MSDSNHKGNGALSAAERDAVQTMFDRLSGSYYDVLGVARDCDRAAAMVTRLRGLLGPQDNGAYRSSDSAGEHPG